MKPSEKIFLRYETLVYKCANKVFNDQLSSMEKQDVLQELRIKLYESILSYGRRWKFYKETGRRKPVPIKFYLQTCLLNKVNDIIRDIKRDESVTSMSSFEHNSFDVGVDTVTDCEVDLFNKKAIINGIDVLQNLNRRERGIYIMHLKGFKRKKIITVAQGMDLDANKIISKQTKYLESIKELLVLENKNEYFSATIPIED